MTKYFTFAKLIQPNAVSLCKALYDPKGQKSGYYFFLIIIFFFFLLFIIGFVIHLGT